MPAKSLHPLRSWFVSPGELRASISQRKATCCTPITTYALCYFPRGLKVQLFIHSPFCSLLCIHNTNLTLRLKPYNGVHHFIFTGTNTFKYFISKQQLNSYKGFGCIESYHLNNKDKELALGSCTMTGQIGPSILNSDLANLRALCLNLDAMDKHFCPTTPGGGKTLKTANPGYFSDIQARIAHKANGSSRCSSISFHLEANKGRGTLIKTYLRTK